jgi:hypothetical protein
MRRMACNLKAERLYLQRSYDIPAMLLVIPMEMRDGWRAPTQDPQINPF